MPIEFYCPECDTYLRTPDAKAGLSLKCPACQERLWVPLESEQREDDLEFIEDEHEPDYLTKNYRDQYRSQLPSEQANWGGTEATEFSAPSRTVDDEPDEFDDLICLHCGAEISQGAKTCAACLRALGSTNKNQKVNFGDILQISWNIYSKNLGLCIVTALVDFLIITAALLVVMIPSLITLVVLQSVPELLIPGFMVVFLLGMGMCVSAMWIGHFRFYLALVRGQNPEISQMFHAGDLVGRMVAASAAFSILFIVGIMMCVLPGLFVFVLLWPFGRFLVDHNCSAGQALRGAYEITCGNAPTSFAVMVFFIVITSISNASVLGAIFVLPFNAVMFSVAYLHFSGEFVTGEE